MPRNMVFARVAGKLLRKRAGHMVDTHSEANLRHARHLYSDATTERALFQLSGKARAQKASQKV